MITTDEFKILVNKNLDEIINQYGHDVDLDKILIKDIDISSKRIEWEFLNIDVSTSFRELFFQTTLDEMQSGEIVRVEIKCHFHFTLLAEGGKND